jgi:hypothetical protein
VVAVKVQQLAARLQAAVVTALAVLTSVQMGQQITVLAAAVDQPRLVTAALVLSLFVTQTHIPLRLQRLDRQLST